MTKAMLQVSSMHVISRKDFSIKGDFQAATTRQKHDLNNKICAVIYLQNVFLWLSLVFFLFCSLILMCAGFFFLPSCLMFVHWSMYVHKIRVISSNTRQFNAFGLPFKVEFKFYGLCLAFFLQMNSLTCFVSGSFAQCKLFGFFVNCRNSERKKIRKKSSKICIFELFESHLKPLVYWTRFQPKKN